MKLKLLKISIFVCALTLSLGLMSAKAQEDTTSKAPTKPPAGQLKAKVENMLEKNREIRNIQLENRKNIQASTSVLKKEFREEVRDTRQETRKEIRDTRQEAREEVRNIRASTTMMFKEKRDEKREIKKEMRADLFIIRKDALVKELNFTLENLLRLRARISEFISKAESSGRDMINAKAQLAVADEKLAQAKVAIEALKAIQNPAPNTNTSATDINLEKPRKVGDDAIKAVKDARNALKKVVAIITSSKPPQATSTPPTPLPTVN